MYDVIIAGGGPAGLNAALYAARSGLSCLVLEKMFAGGQMATTSSLENYIGFPDGIDAVTLAMQMEQQAKGAGAEIRYDEIISVELQDEIKKITTKKETFEAKTVILCMGASPRQLGADGEDRLRARGVSYCATCDGALYKGKTVAVVGGGDTALEDALFLAKYCKKVYLIHRRDAFRGTHTLAEKVKALENVELVMSHVVTEIKGEARVSALTVENRKNGSTHQILLDGIFIAVGTVPNTDLVKEQLPLDDQGYVVTDDAMQTALPGVFAAGDLRQKLLRQVITAASDGAVAAFSALRYLSEH